MQIRWSRLHVKSSWRRTKLPCQADMTILHMAHVSNLKPQNETAPVSAVTRTPNGMQDKCPRPTWEKRQKDAEGEEMLLLCQKFQNIQRIWDTLGTNGCYSVCVWGCITRVCLRMQHQWGQTIVKCAAFPPWQSSALGGRVLHTNTQADSDAHNVSVT